MAHDPSLDLLASQIVRDWPFDEDILRRARGHLVETIGTSLAGVRERSVQAMLSTVTPAPASLGVRSLASATRVSRRDAATCNATSGHAHDFDDDDPYVIVGHPSVAIVGALLAIADSTALPLERALRAYVIGVETMSRLGSVVNPGHYNAGWHCTSTLGVFGAAAACSVALRAPQPVVERALGIAATLSGGLKENFGSDLKPLQVGFAAGHGLWACELAQASVEPSASALFGARGFVRLLGASQTSKPSVAFGSPAWAVETPGVNVKLYPCCSSTHTALDALLDLRGTASLSPQDIERIDVWIGEDVPAILIHDVPASGLEGKFSMRYCLAAAALAGRPGLHAFTDDAVRDPRVRSFIERIQVHTDASLPRVATGVTHQTRVRVTTRSGEQLQREVAVPRGSPGNPCSPTELKEKFLACAAFGLDGRRAARVWTALDTMQPGDPLSLVLDTVHSEGAS